MSKRPIARLVAYHEAAHATCDELLGWSVTSVSIRADISSLGRCLASPTERQLSIEQYLMSYLAGLVAEEMIHPGAMDFQRRCGSRMARKDRSKVNFLPIVPRLSEVCSPTSTMFLPDTDTAEDAIVERSDWHSFTMLARLTDYAEESDAEMGALVRRISEKVNLLLWKHWAAVEMLAEELLQFGEVDGDRVRAILAGTKPRELPAVLPESLPRETGSVAAGSRSKLRRAVEGVAVTLNS